MEMNKSLKGFICLILTVLSLFALTVPCAAAKADVTINVCYAGINLFVEGKLILPKDSAGNDVDPFIYNGTTFLPVRAVSNALGKNVEWSADTATVTIHGSAAPTAAASEAPKSGIDPVYEDIQVSYNNIKIIIDGEEITPKDSVGNVVEPFIYNGTTYLPVRAVGDSLGKTVGWDDASKSVYLTTTKSSSGTQSPSSPATDYSNGNMGDLGAPSILLQSLTPISYGPDRLSTRLVKSAIGLYDVNYIKVTDGIAFYNNIATKAYEVTYDLEGKYKTFAGIVSVDSEDNATGSYVLTIYADGKEVYVSRKYNDYSQPFTLIADIENAKELKFRLTSDTEIEGAGSNMLIPVTIIRGAALYE